MATGIALLRGINVGTAKRVPMAELRDFFDRLGFKDVKTLLNSGNVVFSGPKASEAKVEAAFTARFGFSSRITILTEAELNAAIEENPLTDVPDPSRFFVAFLKTAEHRELLLLHAQKEWAPDAFALGARVAWLWCPAGALDSPLSQSVNKTLKDSVTVRNWSTVLKLRALANAAPEPSPAEPAPHSPRKRNTGTQTAPGESRRSG